MHEPLEAKRCGRWESQRDEASGGILEHLIWSMRRTQCAAAGFDDGGGHGRRNVVLSRAEDVPWPTLSSGDLSLSPAVVNPASCLLDPAPGADTLTQAS